MDWRDEVPSLADQLWYMYENKIGTDLQIAVTNDEKVQSFDCHRTIMRRLSFNFELQDDDENFMYVDVGDMDPDLFDYIIKFAYTDKIVFKSFKDSIQIHRVASNYQMNHLRKECENFMQNKVDKDSVWSLLSHTNKGPDLTALTDYFLTGQTCACLESPEFLSCNQTTLELLLSQESINATELQLIQAVLKWTRHKNGNKPFDSETARRILGPCISLLRFLCLTAADFSTYVAQSGLISNEDALLVLINLSTKGQAKLPSYICTTDVPRKPCSAAFKVNCDAAVEVRKEEEDEKTEGAECLPAAPAVQSQKIRRSKKAKAEKIQRSPEHKQKSNK
ncbi:kelch-like protein 7 isoform X3 [Neocloeon triangulifer]|nr:kelch-like protein 7 isoform X3 [Neocloeon triangulifer]XP_059481544.1 kelch-like protein 7 isoform X3 [Neocloeon triangulifer]